MLTDRGPRGASDRARGIRFAAPVAVVLSLIVGALVAPSANADTIAMKRQQANRVYQEIVASQAQLEGVIQKYDQASLRLRQTKAAIRENRAALGRAKHNLLRARKDLAGSLVASYKRGAPDALQAVLASKSLSQMFDEINLMKRATNYNAKTITAIRSYRSQVVRRERALTEQRTRRAAAARQQAARKHQIQGAISYQRNVLASVKADIRHLVYLRQQAWIAAAKARAAAASRTLQTARSTAAPVTSGLTTGLGATADSQSKLATGTPDAATATTDATVAAPPATSAAAEAAQVALGEQGVPYHYGGESPSGFDCSGLVAWSFAKVGISLPHSSYDLYNVGTHVAQSDLQPGDLVFFNGLGHVGIYIGGGEYVHAPQTGDVVRVASLSSDGSYVGAVRVG